MLATASCTQILNRTLETPSVVVRAVLFVLYSIIAFKRSEIPFTTRDRWMSQTDMDS